MTLINLHEESWFDAIYNSSKAVNLLRNSLNYNNQYQQNQQLLQTLQQSVDFINTQFTSCNKFSIKLYIVPTVNKDLECNRNKTNDFVNEKEFILSLKSSNSYILLSRNCTIVQKQDNSFVENLIENQGQGNFAKILLYHKTGQHLYYLLSNNLLIDIFQNNENLSVEFIKQFDPLIQDFLNSWNDKISINKTYEEQHIDYLFQSILKNSMADCWSCICLFRENLDNGLINQNNEQEVQDEFDNIIASLIESRELTHQNDPATGYSTYNALTRLYINYKNQKLKTNQDWIDITQQSIQEGLILNLKEIFNSPKTTHKNLINKINKYKTKNNNDLNQIVD